MDTIEELKKLKSLLDQEAITEKEFEELKTKLINKQTQTSLTETDATIYTRSTTKVSPSLSKKIVITSILVTVSLIVILGIIYLEPIKEKMMGKSPQKAIVNKDVIYENGEKLGVLITKRYTQSTVNDNSNGLLLTVPSGKIWTPLYYEVKVNIGNEYDYGIPVIYPERYGKGWFRDASYSFPIKADFVSYKYSKRNTKPLAGDFFISFSVLYKSATFTFYFLEE